MVVALSALDTLTWSTKSSFQFNDFATLLINHHKTLDRGGQPKTDEEKVMKLLNSMNTSNVPLLTRIELNCIGVLFQDTVMDISTSIAQIFPLVNVKGHKTIVSQTRTSGKTSYSTHVNGGEFTESTWEKRLSNDKYKCIPKQVKKLIGFAKYHGYNEKYPAFLAEKQQNRNDKKRRVSQISYYGPTKDDADKEVMDCAVSKIVQAITKDNAPNDDGAPDESPKSNANTGFSFGRQNSSGGK